MKTKEQLAEEYAEANNDCYTNDFYGFINGYESKEKQIKDKINALKSDLSDVLRPKLTKVEALKLKAQIEILEGLL